MPNVVWHIDDDRPREGMPRIDRPLELDLLSAPEPLLGLQRTLVSKAFRVDDHDVRLFQSERHAAGVATHPQRDDIERTACAKVADGGGRIDALDRDSHVTIEIESAEALDLTEREGALATRQRRDDENRRVRAEPRRGHQGDRLGGWCTPTSNENDARDGRSEESEGRKREQWNAKHFHESLDSGATSTL